MSIGFWQIAIVVILVVLLFGRGKISSLMGDVAKGIKSFKKGMATDTTDAATDTTDAATDATDAATDATDNDSQPKNITESNQDSDNKE